MTGLDRQNFLSLQQDFRGSGSESIGDMWIPGDACIDAFVSQQGRDIGALGLEQLNVVQAQSGIRQRLDQQRILL